MEIQIMKIYDMIEGKWLKNMKDEKKEKEIEYHEEFGIRTRLVTYDEEKEWIEREKNQLKDLLDDAVDRGMMF